MGAFIDLVWRYALMRGLPDGNSDAVARHCGVYDQRQTLRNILSGATRLPESPMFNALVNGLGIPPYLAAMALGQDLAERYLIQGGYTNTGPVRLAVTGDISPQEKQEIIERAAAEYGETPRNRDQQ